MLLRTHPQKIHRDTGSSKQKKEASFGSSLNERGMPKLLLLVQSKPKILAPVASEAGPLDAPSNSCSHSRCWNFFFLFLRVGFFWFICLRNVVVPSVRDVPEIWHSGLDLLAKTIQ